MKVRSKTLYGGLVQFGYLTDNRSDQLKEKIIEERIPQSGNGSYVHHYKVTAPFTGVTSKPGHPNHPIRWENAVFPEDVFWGRLDVQEFRANSRRPLNWDKIPTSSGFSILEILVELRETILMFSRRFWMNLGLGDSVGAIQWGLLPLIRDCGAIVEALRNAYSANVNPYEDTYTVEKTFDPTWHINVGEAGGKLKIITHLTGTIDVTGVPELLQAYDRIGFHPDITQLWNLVPGSFVVDYFYNVGDFLDQAFQVSGGWVQSTNFTGWHSQKIFWEYGIQGNSGYLSSEAQAFACLDFSATCRGSLYIREWMNETIIRVPQGQPAELEPLELPSFTELLNTAYVLIGQTRW